jgi:hypothetical protein
VSWLQSTAASSATQAGVAGADDLFGTWVMRLVIQV